MPKDKLEEAKEILLEEQRKKEQECVNEIQAILDKYGMVIVPGAPTIRPK